MTSERTTQQFPWSKLRQVLWAAGVLGLLLLLAVEVLDAFFGGLDIDGRKPPVEKLALSWLCDIAAAGVMVYYICAAQHRWSGRLWRAGLVVHFIFISFFVLISWLGGRAIGSPLFLPGAVVWLLYAKQNGAFRNAI